jgi:hypothetical protein
LLTQAYCELQLTNSGKSAAEILRSFNPEHNGERIFSYQEDGFKHLIWAVDPQDSGLYDILFDNQIVHKENTIKSTDASIQFKGRILVAEVDTTVTDGASEAASEAFIDGLDCPPIDTWFYKTDNKMGRIFYAWIPEQFVKSTQDAIDINALECFIWEENYVLGKEVDLHYRSGCQTQFPVPKSYKKTFYLLILIVAIKLIQYLLQWLNA